MSVGTAAAQNEDDQARQIARELQCPVCQGQSVADSNSELATQMRAVIRERLRAGENRDAIVDYFIARYGEAILIAPPRSGPSALIWLAPYLGIVVGVGFLVWRLGGRGSPPAAVPSTSRGPGEESGAGLEHYYEEVDRTLDALRDRPIR